METLGLVSTMIHGYDLEYRGRHRKSLHAFTGTAAYKYMHRLSVSPSMLVLLRHAYELFTQYRDSVSSQILG